jgi:SAM-dependent methyltransferase
MKRHVQMRGDPGRGGDGMTALHAAAWRGLARVVQELLDAGADPTARATDGPHAGETAADTALAQGQLLLAVALDTGAPAANPTREPGPVDDDLARTRAFFAERAHTWNDRFHDDEPAYEEAAHDLRPRAGGVVVDLGCGAGRALPGLRRAAGPLATVVGVDVTPEMLDAARHAQAEARARLLLVDVRALPFRACSVDAFFAAGLLHHVPDPDAVLRHLAATAAPAARLAIFQPIGRTVLAARHGRVVEPDEMLDPSVLPAKLAATGWRLDDLDDTERRYLAVASLA